MHDATNHHICFMQHFIVVGVDRDIGMHITVAGVHMQRHEQT